MNTPQYKAFISYVHQDDLDEGKRITLWFHEVLRRKVRFVTGQPVDIFLDKDGIHAGQQWRAEIDQAISEVLLFIPIVTPGYFSHEMCRKELQEFLEHEKKLGRRMVIPIYYQACEQLENEEARAEDQLAQALAATQYVDWRELRALGKNAATVHKELEGLAKRIHEAYQEVNLNVEAEGSAEKEHIEAPPAASPTPTQPSAPKRRRSSRRRRASRDVPAPESAERLVVDPEGDLRTIADALSQVAPGGEVVIRPGVYKEALTLDKTVHVSGEGPKEHVVVESHDDPVLVFDTSMGVVANLTLRQSGSTGSPAIRAVRGRLEVDRCDVSSLTESSVVVDGGADVRIRRTVIHDGSGNGLEVMADGQALVEDSEITQTDSPAIAAVGGEVVIRNCAIHDCSGAVLLQEQARATVEGNDLYAARGAGIISESDSDAVVRNNRIRDSAGEGILVLNGGRATIEENTISGNEQAGVLVGGGSDPAIVRNQICDGKDAGVVVSGSARGTIEDNEICRNQAAGVAIDTHANPTVRGNVIHDGQDAGIYVHDEGAGILEDNDINGNAAAAIWLSTDGNPAVRRNRIHDQPEDGVVVQDKGRGAFEDNDIYTNRGAGVRIASEGNPTIQGCRIHECGGAGVLVEAGGAGILEGNDIVGNASDGVAIVGGANPVIRNNSIHEGGDTGVFVTQGGRPAVEGNDIFQNARAGVWVQAGGSPQLSYNQIHHHSDNGLVFVEGGVGQLERSRVFANGQSGILIGSESKPVLQENVISGNGYTGLRILEGGDVSLSANNDLSGNYVAAVDLFGQLVDEQMLWQVLAGLAQQ